MANVKANNNLRKLMKQSERKAVRGAPPRKLLSKSLTMSHLEQAASEMIIVHTVGEMLAKARSETQLSTRQLAKKVTVSHPRVLAVEKTDTQIEVQTLVRYAQAMGYDVKLSFVPKGGGREIVGELRSR
jgi:ribosome-binding protein aMBF1 (putative translation factor)